MGALEKSNSARTQRQGVLQQVWGCGMGEKTGEASSNAQRFQLVLNPRACSWAALRKSSIARTQRQPFNHQGSPTRPPAQPAGQNTQMQCIPNSPRMSCWAKSFPSGPLPWLADWAAIEPPLLPPKLAVHANTHRHHARFSRTYRKEGHSP